jgi:threonyl-tRNA synthetase
LLESPVSEIKVTLPDGTQRSFSAGTTPLQVGESISPRLAAACFAAKVDGRLVDVYAPIAGNATVELVTDRSPDALDIYRHSCAHLMANAVKELFPEAKIAIGPTIEDGFYYDFDRAAPFAAEDLEAIEKRMAEIIARDTPIRREEMPWERAKALFDGEREPYKSELAYERGQHEPVSIYRQGAFNDFCRGPHLPSTGKIKPGTFKLLSVAGAYWKGDEHNKMLQRIYATAFLSAKDLASHLNRLEEARKRDHRRLGKDLDLFSLSEDVGGGLVLWHPKGAIIRKTIEDFWRDQHIKNGYEFVYSPHIGRSTLWETSGHLDFYKESMYPSMEMENQTFYAKPMNCPFHVKIFGSRHRSYRDLPLRWAELGTVYRYEKSGVLHGLMRVRGFTQDDAHLFVQPEKMEEEVVRVIEFTLFMLRAFGFEEFEAFIATRPEKSVGDLKMWEEATAALKKAADLAGLPYSLDEGGGAFYGPKIDIKIKDCLNRSWQLSTVQFDFNLPERFGLEYVGSDNSHHRPYMIHRALLGSLERFFGILIEHFGGAFPLWLAPEQVRLLPIADRHVAYCQTVARDLADSGLRVTVDARTEKTGYKIREAQLQKVPYMLVVGDREQEGGCVSLRTRTGGDKGDMPLEMFKLLALERAGARSLELD